MSKTFPQESSEAFLNVKSLHDAEKKINQRVLTMYFEKHFERCGFICFFKEKHLALSHLLWVS